MGCSVRWRPRTPVPFRRIPRSRAVVPSTGHYYDPPNRAGIDGDEEDEDRQARLVRGQGFRGKNRFDRQEDLGSQADLHCEADHHCDAVLIG